MNIKFLIGRLLCTVFSHKWGSWENKKYVEGTERSCPRCRLHQNDDGSGSAQYSWMKSSGWVDANPLRKT